MKALLCLFTALLAIHCGAMVLPDSSEPVLEDSNLISNWVRIDPEDKKAETLPTQAWVWQDGGDLMVHLVARIDSTFTKGSISVKDEGTQADYLRVQLITIPDAYFAYYYAAYPLGNLLDGVRDESMDVDYAWDSHYSYESKFGTDTWTVTMRIPLNELRYKQDSPYKWKIIVSRYHYDSNEYYSYPYVITKDGKDYFTKGQDIVLQTPVKHKLDVTFRPYYVKSYDLLRRSSSWDPEHIGMDIAFNPSQRTRIKLALNPDFSDVPMDQARDDYNSKYPPYYNENRFFFIEDIDAFGIDDDVLYTRNIVQPRLAFKATGNSKTLNWGALGAFDKKIVDEGVLINPDDYFQVLAVNPSWRKFQLSNGIVSRVNKGYYNHVYTGSANWEYLPNLYAAYEMIISLRDKESENLPDPQKGYSGSFQLQAKPGDFNFSVGYRKLSKDLALDAGYLYEKDNEYFGGSFGWSKTYAERKVRYASFNAWVYNFHYDLSLDPYYCFSSVMSANLYLASRINFFANGYFHNNVQDLNKDLHKTYDSSLGFYWYKLRSFRVLGNYFFGRTLVYALSEVYPQHRITINTAIYPVKNLSASVAGNWIHYGYDKLLLPGTNMVMLDEEYVVVNAAVDYTPKPTFKISMGSGLSSYEMGTSTASLSFWGNLRYEFKPEWFVYLGLKSAQTQIEPSTWQDPAGDFRKDLSTAYVKLSVTL